MKKITAVIIALSFCFPCLFSCGNNYDEIRDELRGTWGFDFEAYIGMGHCTLEFTSNTVEYNCWYTGGYDSHYTHNGTYEITKDEIIITYKTNNEIDKIDYSYNNGKLKLFYRGSDGSYNEELKPS